MKLKMRLDHIVFEVYIHFEEDGEVSITIYDYFNGAYVVEDYMMSYFELEGQDLNHVLVELIQDHNNYSYSI